MEVIMKKILFVIPSLSNGGAEKVVSKISSGLVNKGYDVTLLTFFDCEKEYLIDGKVKRINLSKGYEKDYNSINTLKRFKLIRKVINEIEPDFIFPFLNHVCIYTFISCIFSKYRKRIVFTERCNQKFTNKRNRLVKNLCQVFVKRILVQNNGQKLDLSKRNQRKTCVIANPIDSVYLDYKKNSVDECKNIISLGRLSDQKDYPLAIETFSSVLKKYPNLTYHIFGKGENEDKLRKLIKEKNLENKVVLEGFTTNIDDIYKNAGMFLMTSKFEGMPNALAESLAVGLPCISSDCDFGPSDLIENESMGILVKEHTVEAFEKAMLHMIENYSFYASKSNERKEIMRKKYSLDVIIDEWIKFIECK